MVDLALILAINGTLILALGMVSGLMLHYAIRRDRGESSWHLAHAGISGRGVLLIAVAGIVPLIDLTETGLGLLCALLLFFAWSSSAAMVFGAVAGVRGQRWEGSAANKLMYAVYVVGVVAVVPALVLLVSGLRTR